MTQFQNVPKSQDVPTDVQVTLLLEGGHRHTLRLEPNASLLRQLLGCLSDPVVARSQRLFQIPIDEGRSLLSFPGDRLIGLVTNPPIVVKSSQGMTPATESSDVIPSHYIQYANFLDADIHAQLVDWVANHEAEFVGSTTSTNAADYRKSLVLYNLPDIAKVLQTRIRDVMPTVLDDLAIAPFQPTDIEAQLTAHNDGHYYQVHNDNGSPDTATRRLTYVYYFYQQPKAFSGGELRIYDSRIRNQVYEQADSFHTVTPDNNSIVFFPSHYMHEVMPIQCPSQHFAHSRFTINGWVRQ
jgi:Rps23 Pro-64 3,4-dihydroxylase Tpa1-like proline 4-hydroxylase